MMNDERLAEISNWCIMIEMAADVRRQKDIREIRHLFPEVFLLRVQRSKSWFDHQ